MATALGPDGSATQTVVLLFPERLVVLAADNRRSPASRHTLLVSALLSRILLHGLPLQPNVLVVSAPAAESTPLSVSPARLTLRLELASREQVLTWQAAIQQRVRRSETSNWRAAVLNPFAREGRNAAQPEPVAADAAGAYGGDGGRRWLFGRQTRASEAHVPAGAAAAPEEAAAGVGGAPKNLPPEVSEFDVVSAFAKSRPAVPMRAVIKDEPEMAGGSVAGLQHSSGSFGVQVGGGVDHGASIGAASAAAVGKRKTVKVSRDVLDEQNQRLTQAEARLRALQVELDALKSEHQKLHA